MSVAAFRDYAAEGGWWRGGYRIPIGRAYAKEKKKGIKVYDTHGQVIEGPCLLDVVERRLELAEFFVDAFSCFFGFGDLRSGKVRIDCQRIVCVEDHLLPLPRTPQWP